MASLTTTNTFFSSFLEKLLESNNFEFTPNHENLIHHIKKLSNSVLANILMERGFNPANPVPDTEIIDKCVDTL